MTLSVCIATFERPHLLRGTLEALAQQKNRPDEIVVSDASMLNDAGGMINEFEQRFPELPIRLIRTERRGLPWQRWWAFRHAKGEIIFFIDDDVTLASGAIGRLLEEYTSRGPDVMGVGYPMTITGEPLQDCGTGSLKYRWLGTAGRPPGDVTEGGLTVDQPVPREGGEVHEVRWLCGGAMSFRRSALERLGPLGHLYALYDIGIGKGEDGVLSHLIAREGRLLALALPLAFHPPAGSAERTANPAGGFRRGLLETWGRAHTIRWLADDPSRSASAWARQALLELARTAAGTLRHPGDGTGWARLRGDLEGIGRSIVGWSRIPRDPRGPSGGTE